MSNAFVGWLILGWIRHEPRGLSIKEGTTRVLVQVTTTDILMMIEVTQRQADWKIGFEKLKTSIYKSCGAGSQRRQRHGGRQARFYHAYQNHI